MAHKVPVDRLCTVCGKQFKRADVMPAAMVRDNITDLIQREHPEWTPESFICFKDLNHYRTAYVEQVLQNQKGELSSLETEVVKSLQEQELIAQNTNTEFEKDRTFGAQLADQIARFGGSWPFLIGFAVVLAIWVTINSMTLLMRPFDPFPYILLNLVLSCLASIQAPVIMMSQNRQSMKDRVRSEHDYRINLKAELEIRHLHTKLDMLLTHQWQRLLEIQEMQMELLQESRKR